MVNERPIIIVGAARSGTRFLRDGLAASDDATAIPYVVNYVWRRGNHDLPHDALTPDLLTSRQRNSILGGLTTLHRRAGGTRTRLIEKTVSNTLRVPFVKAVMPNAQFVYLERDGQDTVRSALKEWTTPSDTSYLLQRARYIPLRDWRYVLHTAGESIRSRRSKGGDLPIWGPRYAGIRDDLETLGIETTVANQWIHCARAARASASQVGGFSIHYNELGEVGGKLSELVDWLGFSDGDLVVERIASRFDPSLPATDQSLGPEVREAIDRLEPIAG